MGPSLQGEALLLLAVDPAGGQPLDQAQEGQDQHPQGSSFSDLRPTDWVYQALFNLIERHRCLAGDHEAALLNGCLARVSEFSDELQHLIQASERELAELQGRVDGLGAQVAELQATPFSTTTTQ